MAGKLRITLVKSTIGAIPKHRKTVEALGLRKLKGVSISEFEKKYDRKINEAFKLDEAIKKKYLIIKDDYLFINPSKIYVMNEIINMIM